MKSLAPLLALSFIFIGNSWATLNPIPLKINPKLFSASFQPEIREQIISDLKLVNSIVFSKISPLHEKIFGKQIVTREKLSNNRYVGWFSERIKRISVGRCMSDGGAVACVIPLLSSDSMRITQHYLDMDAPQIARMSVLFHEAKHTEPNFDGAPLNGSPDLRFWGHVKCPNPFLDENNEVRVSIWTGLPLSGVDGCDSTPVGAYGTAVIMLKNIALYSVNTSEKLREDAQLYSDNQLIRISNPEAHSAIVNDR